MKRKLACADFTFPLLSHDQSLELIAMLGFTGVDIGLFEKRSHLWPSRQFKMPQRAGKALRKKAENVGLKVADVFLQCDVDFVPYAINHPEARRRRRARDWFDRTLDYAAACGSGHVTTLPGVPFGGESIRQSRDRSIDELAWRVERAQQHGITFGVEAHVGSIAPKPKPALQLVNSVSGLTLTLDYTHFTQIGLSDKQVEPLLEHASHFHVRGACKGRLQANFEQNVIDYRRILRQLDAAGYRHWLGIEYVWIDWEHCNECDNLSETIRYRDFLSKN